MALERESACCRCSIQVVGVRTITGKCSRYLIYAPKGEAGGYLRGGRLERYVKGFIAALYGTWTIGKSS